MKLVKQSERTLADLAMALGITGAWRDRKPSTRAIKDEQLKPKVVEAFGVVRGTYGRPRLLDGRIHPGFELGRRRIAQLMRELGLQGVMPRKFRVTTGSDHKHPIVKIL